MRKTIIAITLASSISLSACASRNTGDMARGAAYGAAAGTVAGAVLPGVGIIEGAAVGTAIGGLAGAYWADTNNDGYVDGYNHNGTYYAGAPQGYDPTRRIVTTAAGGAALGAAAGALIPGLGILEGAVVGAAIGGLAGAFWADQNGDGRVDGYYQNGTYYPGAPAGATTTPTYSTPARSGERG